MNEHLTLICALPTVLFASGAFLYTIGTNPGTEELRSVGKLFMVGAIVMVLQILYSIYL